MVTFGDASILTDIKEALGGIEEANTDFDQNLLLHINGALGVLHQLGIGPDNGLYVNDSSVVWDDLISDTVIQGLARQFVLCSVKIGFDPPSSSFVLNALQDQRKELSFRLTVEHDRFKNGIHSV